jgi:hypothetical protein
MAGAVSSEDPSADGVVHYRTDGLGSRVAVLPATCRHGHDLASSGYRARESNGLLRVRCSACASGGVANPFWTLQSQGAIANLAELDDEPYPHLGQVQ